MKAHDFTYNTYLQILKEELIPSFGCTEPVAIALAAAAAKELLSETVVRVEAKLSGNIIKNAKSVTVPNTGGLKGIEAAVAAGIVAGDASKELEVIADVSAEKQDAIRSFLETIPIQVQVMQSEHILDIKITIYTENASGSVRVVDAHNNIVQKEKNNEVIWQKTTNGSHEDNADRKLLSVKDILDFTEMVEIEEIKDLVGRQISYNMAIAEEGMKENCGANIGKVLVKTYGNDIMVRAKAMAAAGSDARMSGCSLPVVIVSGSGNQGITASVPVAVYADYLKVPRDKKLRAVLLSDLITIHQKTGIGKLSAYCGAISAGCGAGAGIAYLHGGDYTVLAHTLVNALAIASGVICDGAKASCAAKIAIAVEAGIMGYFMYREGQEFKAGDGIVTKGIEANIENISQLAQVGMKETDKEILHLMVEREKERCSLK